MCESNAFIRTAGGEELVLREVVTVTPVEGGFRVQSLFGEEAFVRGRLEEVDLLRHKIVFCERDPGFAPD